MHLIYFDECRLDRHFLAHILTFMTFKLMLLVTVSVLFFILAESRCKRTFMDKNDMLLFVLVLRLSASTQQPSSRK